MVSNLETAAEAYARKVERAYVVKRGGRVPANVAFSIYLWAFNRFLANPEIENAA